MSIKSIRWAQGNKSATIAKEFANFIGSAKKSIDIAIYDFRLKGDDETVVVEALKKAAQKLTVRIAYDHTKQPTTTTTGKGGVANDPAPRGTMEWVQQHFPRGTKVKTKAIAGSHLMHNKYIIRDGSAVWMGSANFTDDAWTDQENNVVQVASKQLASHYAQDFNDLWRTGNLKGSGKNDYGELTVGKTKVEFAFAPGEGSAVASLFVDAIQGAGARGNVHVASMVMSSGPILGALVDHLRAGGGLTGIYDGPQMKNVERAWKKSKTSASKLDSWNVVKRHLVSKSSTPYSPTGVHDFMHNKLLVTSKVVLTGSFNLSRNAESNAENVLAIHDPKLAKSYVGYIDSLVDLYAVRRRKAA